MTESALITIIVVTALLILGNFAFWAFVHRNRVEQARQEGKAEGRKNAEWHRYVAGHREGPLDEIGGEETYTSKGTGR